jgi:hypothetical protein
MFPIDVGSISRDRLDMMWRCESNNAIVVFVFICVDIEMVQRETLWSPC